MSILDYLAKVKTNGAVWAQACHFLIAYAIIVTSAALWRQEIAAAVGLIAFVLFLELWYDPKYENEPFLFSGLIDTVFYSLGIVCGFLLVGR